MLNYCLQHWIIILSSLYIDSEQLMQPVSCLDQNNQKYCIINPLGCLDLAMQVPVHSTIHCKFCKSYILPNANNTKQQKLICDICKCVNQVSPTIPHTSHDALTNNNSVQMYKIMDKTNIHNNKLRILLIYEASLSQTFRKGIQCLFDILSNLGYNQRESGQQNLSLQIACIFYDESVKILQLQKDGRVLRVQEQAYDLIVDKFYPVSEESLSALLMLTEQLAWHKTTQNGSKILNQMISYIHFKTLVVWIGSLTQNYHYTVPSSIQYINLYFILKIPRAVSTMQLSSNLSLISNTCSKVIFLPCSSLAKMSEEEQEQLIKKIHYGLYDMMYTVSVMHWVVEASRQKKYPPEVLTTQRALLHSLTNSVIIRLGKEIVHQEKVQLRIKYVEQNGDAVILCVTFQPNKLLESKVPTRQIIRYLRMFILIKSQPNRRRIKQREGSTSQEHYDVYNFLNFCSLLQHYQLIQCIQRFQSIFIVWPWIGFQNNAPSFIYFYKGFAKIKNNNFSAHRSYQNELRDLQSMCQSNYTCIMKIVPVYYSQLIQTVQLQQRYLQGSDDQNDSQISQEQQRFYLYKLKKDCLMRQNQNQI